MFHGVEHLTRGEAIDKEQQCTAFHLFLANGLFKTSEPSFLFNQLRKVHRAFCLLSLFSLFLSY